MDPKVRKKTLRMLSNGVYVITSRNDTQFGAATVTWVSQASFRPPLLMVAVRRESNVFRCMVKSGVAALHIVGDSQQDVAQRFFYPTRADGERINGEPFSSGKTAAPILACLPVHIECELACVVETEGDHAVVILKVVEAECTDHVRPLTIAQTPWEYGG